MFLSIMMFLPIKAPFSCMIEHGTKFDYGHVNLKKHNYSHIFLLPLGLRHSLKATYRLTAKASI